MEKSIAFPLCSSVILEPQKQTRVLFPEGTVMENCIPINDLDELPDGYLLWDKVYRGQEGALLILINPRAHDIVFGSSNTHWSWWFIPMDKCIPLVTMCEQEGLELSYG